MKFAQICQKKVSKLVNLEKLACPGPQAYEVVVLIVSFFFIRSDKNGMLEKKRDTCENEKTKVTTRWDGLFGFPCRTRPTGE